MWLYSSPFLIHWQRFIQRGLSFAFGSFQSFYALTFIPSSTASAISWIGTIQSWLLIACGLISGPLFDLGYFPTMVVAGSFLSVFGFMMLSIAHKYYAIFLSQGICVGLGFGLLYVPTVALVSQRFSENRAVALGVATSGAPTGGIIYTVIFNQLISRVGFGWTVRIMGFVMLFLFVMAALLLSLEGGLKSRVVSDRPRVLFDTRALKDLPFWSFTVSNFLIYLGYLAPYIFFPTYAQTALLTSRSLGSYILMVSQAASIVGRVATTIFAHFWGSMVSWVLCGMLSGMLCLCWISADNVPRFIAFVAFYGKAISIPLYKLNWLGKKEPSLGLWSLFHRVSFLMFVPILTPLGLGSAWPRVSAALLP